jgi:hypothetical protein
MDMYNLGPSKPKPNFSKPSQIQTEESQGYQRKRVGFLWIPLAGINPFNGLR